MKPEEENTYTLLVTLDLSVNRTNYTVWFLRIIRSAFAVIFVNLVSRFSRSKVFHPLVL